ncbi:MULTISPECIES: Type 1 glutamine amidotransferase-like domain-containing protein [unclassified Neisseria]|uniref:Type 1 glutamine amidotransferase-like domain-containing protein n=1 Tax=unclassified Neisseria TaxID=2623750 RepID=UPI002666A421|nr:MULTISPECIES: Type 1 glutamine amidotransferase-like domain-containing protein [unclassified Neisseria]MDO1510715.1 Type 1 glutamine amidotransferase-like domain-containing protein [Neisseria sp. MVDL19-042950]MDO1564367.1 Type 1 glutamine amidotransferase-like domain-containing protein [Neisseria sp. MVDL20-010259]
MKLFLTSYFAQTFSLLPPFLSEPMQGKTVSFISTAADVETVDFYVEEARQVWRAWGVEIDEIDIAALRAEEIARKLQHNHYIYVSGGNTFYLLAQLRLKQADKVLAALIASGKPYIGESAGSMILAGNLSYVREMDEVGKAEYDTQHGLGVLDVCPLPHDGEEPFAEITRIIKKQYAHLPLCPLTNSQALLINGDKPVMNTQAV